MEGSYTHVHVSNRVEALSAIRSRVSERVATWLRDEHCLQLALACATRSANEIVPFMFSKSVSGTIEANREYLAITTHEWKALFGSECSPSKSKDDLKQILDTPIFDDYMNEIASALRCTILEPTQSKLWAKNWTKVVLYVAIHMTSDESMIGSALGNMVSADCRRLEDMRAELDDDEGTEVMLFSRAVEAISEAVA